MNSLIFEESELTASCEDVPGALSRLIEAAVAAFDADRGNSRRYLMRASALMQARQLARTGRENAARVLQPRGGLATWQVNRVIDYIETHLAEKITGQDLADLVDLSVRQLLRAFKVSAGASPSRYISLRRFELACTMMKTTREPLSCVAIACGLCDQAQLCRMFRRIAGVSPAVWRRANEREPE